MTGLSGGLSATIGLHALDAEIVDSWSHLPLDFTLQTVYLKTILVDWARVEALRGLPDQRSFAHPTVHAA